MMTFKSFLETTKEPWQMAGNSPEYAAMSVDQLDRVAFGFTRDEIKTLMPNQLRVKWRDDYAHVVAEQKASGLSPKAWASKINLSEPIDVAYEGGKFVIEDGHHRYYAAKILNRPLNVSLTIKDKPHRAIVVKALKEGKPVPPEVLADYPDLRYKRRT